MKKINIILCAALTLGVVSCKDTSDLGMMQVNPQETVYSANGLTLDPSAAYDGLIDLEHANGNSVSIISKADAAGLPADATVSYELYVADNADMIDAEVLPVTENGVSVEDLNAAIVTFYNITPEEVHPWMGVAAYSNVGGTKSRLGGYDFYYMKRQVNVLPIDRKLDIEPVYYLGGTLSKKLDHSDIHSYIDNTFTLTFDVTDAEVAAGFKWQIVPQSQESNPDPAKCFGPAGPDKLALGGMGTVTTAGTYRLSCNMLDKTYSLNLAYEVLYTPGTGNGWSQEASMQLFTDNYVNYTGFTYTGADATGEFKLCPFTNWDVNWGLNGGQLTSGGDNIKVEPAGLYWVDVNLSDMTIATTHVDKMGVIGLNGNWDNDIEMTAGNEMKTWTANITADADTEFKFRVNGGWDINLGGDMDALSVGGDNIKIAAGTYTVTLDLSKLPYSCTVVKK